jgi:hypothetical protein
MNNQRFSAIIATSTAFDERFRRFVTIITFCPVSISQTA